MIKRKWPFLLLSAAGASALLAAVACTTTGPDAPPRTNGCIAEECFDAFGGSLGTDTGPGPSDGSTPPSDAPPGGYPDPLKGTTKAATLVKGGAPFQALEGPVWMGNHLLFSDPNPSIIYKLGADGMTISTFRNGSGGANGNAVDSQGRLVTCETFNRRVTRSNGDGSGLMGLTGQFMGSAYNAPNDVVVRKDGNIYFTDPSYGEDPDAAAPRQPKQGLYRIAPAGMVTRIQQYASNPNGVAISPDGNTLYVADTSANLVNYWALAADGLPSNEQKFADVSGPDGLAMDDAGNLYIAATTGVEVFDKTGTLLGTVAVAEQPSNCTFGGSDRKTLFITARTGLYKIALNVPGLP